MDASDEVSDGILPAEGFCISLVRLHGGWKGVVALGVASQITLP